ncbi:protein of unassigned function [Methylobacterium oryzae CBMB20]|uniref:Protein of unassigned function n=1 Tax=Methylobacterium oryzae CBMB20 TaxID=693986 RepID=A0A089NN37_9HYPH|nr:protein of unassigned function [Methylobacterium oryzae CBMB20]
MLDEQWLFAGLDAERQRFGGGGTGETGQGKDDAGGFSEN